MSLVSPTLEYGPTLHKCFYSWIECSRNDSGGTQARIIRINVASSQFSLSLSVKTLHLIPQPTCYHEAKLLLREATCRYSNPSRSQQNGQLYEGASLQRLAVSSPGTAWYRYEQNEYCHCFSHYILEDSLLYSNR